ncbi:hypothetical protein AXF42_Ash006128 [Apostasia shenzhenica]|uniref:Uncharacterized protein n=1 Tax=Apostasia shenzhenica TaxID=1088818 RepID=A0A2I0B0A8_9ASPA|nr:hypothetical protein AXF42_Ash006128 [Apostasia shenzhenica]
MFLLCRPAFSTFYAPKYKNKKRQRNILMIIVYIKVNNQNIYCRQIQAGNGTE